MITMGLGGLWHGAAWNFVIWGLYQGLLLCVNRLFARAVDNRPVLRAWFDLPGARIICWAVTIYFVLLGWIIFRVTDLQDLLIAVQAFVLFDGRWNISSLGLGVGSPIVAGLACALFVAFHLFSFFVMRWAEVLDRMPEWLLPLVYIVLGALFFLGWPSENTQFIYFQF
jgi:hypothetical protein